VFDAPVLVTIDDINFDEDSSMIILLAAFDVEGDLLDFSVYGGKQISGSLTGTELTFTPNLNFYGSEEFTVIVSDGELSSSQTFTVTVTAVNDAPVLAAVDAVSFVEDTSTSIALSGSDVDGDDITYSISEGTDITATLNGSTLSFTAAQDFNGSESFTAVTVTVNVCEFVYSPSLTDAVKDSLPLKSCAAVKLRVLPLSVAVISVPSDIE
jgi:hypothetical protein